MAEPIQCARCVFGRKNTGLIIPAEAKRYFCDRTEAIRDPAVERLMRALMSQLAGEGRCPAFDGGEDHPDAYWAEDRKSD